MQRAARGAAIFANFAGPPPPLLACLGGTAAFDGAVEAAILGLAWPVALLLMERRPAMAGPARGDPGGRHSRSTTWRRS
ncbi:MAG TPA: hypothetical protein VFZ88_11230 [Sphingomicrobium sp.]